MTWGDIGPIASAVAIRHDIVHRNGRKREGGAHDVNADQVLDLITQAEGLAWRVHNALNPTPAIDSEDYDQPY